MAWFVFLILSIGIWFSFSSPRIPILSGKLVLSEWAVIAFIASFLVKNKWLKLWCLYVIFRLITQYNKFSYMEANTIFMYVIFFQILVDRLTDKQIHWIYNAIAVVVLGHMLWMFGQFFGVLTFQAERSSEIDTTGRIIGMMSEPGSAGAIVALGVPVFLRKRWRWFLPIVIWAFFLPKSLAATGAAVVGIIIYVWIKYRRLRIPVLACILLLFTFYIVRFESWTDIKIGTTRFEAWRRMWMIAKSNIVIGLGIGQFRLVFPAIDTLVLKNDMRWFNAHNPYLEHIFNMGLIGFGLMMGFIGSTIERFLKNKTDLGFIAFIGVVISLVMCLAHFLVRTTPFVISIIYMAIMCNQIKEKKIWADGIRESNSR